MFNFLPLPHPNTEQLQILMYSCACLAEHCIACMFCEICFRFVLFFLLEMVHWRVCTVCFLCIYKLEHLFYEM